MWITVAAGPDGNCADSGTIDAQEIQIDRRRRTPRSTASLASVGSMPRRKLRSQGEVVERSRVLGDELRAALAKLPDQDPAVVDAVWRGEALRTPRWGPQLPGLPPADERFDREEIAAIELGDAKLREDEEIELERESARLWHW